MAPVEGWETTEMRRKEAYFKEFAPCSPVIAEKITSRGESAMCIVYTRASLKMGSQRRTFGDLDNLYQ